MSSHSLSRLQIIHSEGRTMMPGGCSSGTQPRTSLMILVTEIIVRKGINGQVVFMDNNQKRGKIVKSSKKCCCVAGVTLLFSQNMYWE